MKKSLPLIALLGLVGVFASGTAYGDTLVQTNSASVDHIGYDFNFNQFDSTLGTLTGVELTITSTAGGNFTISNASRSTTTSVTNIQDYLYLVSYQLDELSGGTNLPTINLATTITSGSNPVSKQIGAVPGSTTFSITSSPAQYLANNDSFNLTISSYTGVGTVTFNLTDATSATLTGGTPTPNYNNISDPTTVKLAYTYTAIPEPSTYAFFGLGALALVVAYRRRVT